MDWLSLDMAELIWSLTLQSTIVKMVHCYLVGVSKCFVKLVGLVCVLCILTLL